MTNKINKVNLSRINKIKAISSRSSKSRVKVLSNKNLKSSNNHKINNNHPTGQVLKNKNMNKSKMAESPIKSRASNLSVASRAKVIRALGNLQNKNHLAIKALMNSKLNVSNRGKAVKDSKLDNKKAKRKRKHNCTYKLCRSKKARKRSDGCQAARK